MKITILGCGTAAGVPMISIGWGNCDPDNPKNRRLRPSILVETRGTSILVDTGPDLREQLLGVGTRHLDGVLFTHAHADHLNGIDDLREVNRAMKAPIPVYGSTVTLDNIAERFAYVFEPMDPQSPSIFKPWLQPHAIDGRFSLGKVDILAFDQDHGFSRTTGYRIGDFAYSTDAWELPEESLRLLEGLDLWIVGCLLDRPHPTHAHVAKVLSWVERLKPKRTLLTHMSARLDYETLRASLPEGVEPAYDGMIIELVDNQDRKTT